ncbi:MAG: hypothetical protein KGQ49_00720, partial [Verrucomicrobia bacterium]|nr:hypothetical protein [Verrucomicrobiota bacterium]
LPSFILGNTWPELREIRLDGNFIQAVPEDFIKTKCPKWGQPVSAPKPLPGNTYPSPVLEGAPTGE